MSFANTTAHSEWSANSGKTYISTENFSGNFFTYTTSQDASLTTIGTLTTVATAANAATSLFTRGHHLVLNGRKLTPGVNPMNAITRNTTPANNPFIYGSTPGQVTVPLSPSGVSAATLTGSSFAPKFMVGVMDIQTGLNGFIDPTNVVFALYDKNRPVADYLIDMAAGLTAANARELVSSGQSDRLNTTSIVLPTGGPYAAGGASSGTAVLTAAAGGLVSQIVTSSIVTPSSIIILTPVSGVTGSTATNGVASVSAITTGSFTISFTGVSVPNNTSIPAVNFLIIN